MTNYIVKLTPQLINLATEGSQDSSILNGKSIQRTFNMYEVANGNSRKMIDRVKDGDEFNNTTFQNSTGIGTFEANLNFTADQILAAGTSYNENGFIGVGCIILLNPDQELVLNSYNFPWLVFDCSWQEGSYFVESKTLIFALGDTFDEVAVVVPLDFDTTPVCSDIAIWNMPLNVTNFINGGEIELP